MANFLTPTPHYPRKWPVDLLFKVNRILKYLTNFKISASTFFHVGVKCMDSNSEMFFFYLA